MVKALTSVKFKFDDASGTCEHSNESGRFNETGR